MSRSCNVSLTTGCFFAILFSSVEVNLLAISIKGKKVGEMMSALKFACAFDPKRDFARTISRNGGQREKG